MARAAEKLGRLVDAHETYLKIVKEKLPAKAPSAFIKAQADAEREIELVAARLAYATLTVRGPTEPAPVLLMDGSELPPAVLGISLPVDPGVHVFKARGDDTESAELRVQFAEGSKQAVVLTLPSAAGSKAAAPPRGTAATMRSETETVAVEPGGGSVRNTWGVVALVAGAGALGAGAYFTVASLSSRSSADKIFAVCDPGCSDDDRRRIDSEDHAATRSRNLAIASSIVGGLAVTTGLVLLLTAPSRASGNAGSRSGTQLRFVAGTQWIGAQGSF